MSFAIFPNELICKILKKLTLQEQLKLRLVCSRWCAQIEELCQKKKSLKLFDRYASNQKFRTNSYHVSSDYGQHWSLKNVPNDDDLILDFARLGKLHSIALARLFPNVTNIGVYSIESSIFMGVWDVSDLLESYTDTLVSLTLFVRDFTFHPNEISSPNILSIINRMSALEQLHLFCQNQSKCDIQLFDHILPVLPQLESITLPNSLCSTPLKYRLIEPYANFALTHLRLDYLRFSPFIRRPFSVLLWTQPPLCANLTNLRLHQVTYYFYKSIKWDKLPLLKCLYISFMLDNDPLTDLFGDLCQLTNLAELELCRIFDWTTNNLTLPQLSKMSTPLHRVTKLTLSKLFQDWKYKTKDDLKLDKFNGEHFCKTLATWLPNLEQFYVRCGLLHVESTIEQNLYLFPHLQHQRLL